MNEKPIWQTQAMYDKIYSLYEKYGDIIIDVEWLSGGSRFQLKKEVPDNKRHLFLKCKYKIYSEAVREEDGLKMIREEKLKRVLNETL